MVCPGNGLPSELVADMFHSSEWRSEEGLGLSMCRKILKLMNGDVQYIRESKHCYFHIMFQLPLPSTTLGKDYQRIAKAQKLVLQHWLEASSNFHLRTNSSEIEKERLETEDADLYHIPERTVIL
ncbi:hypothetical protein L6452_04019 [Arctium lappa]|uniref:Uncharacterized protein n=1 Tax=Arctium lappa TaxID=4217 RepID=A0ACB9FPU6_ARCLA|nr:hypothetical protein L6452_04019 [Arctium lappa]